MNCPNCGLPNPDSAKFCSNCGTSFAADPPRPPVFQSQSQYQAPPPPYQNPGTYSGPTATRGGNSLGKNIGIGCLVAFLVFLFLGLSCTRACLHLGRHSRYTYRR